MDFTCCFHPKQSFVILVQYPCIYNKRMFYCTNDDESHHKDISYFNLKCMVCILYTFIKYLPYPFSRGGCISFTINIPNHVKVIKSINKLKYNKWIVRLISRCIHFRIRPFRSLKCYLNLNELQWALSTQGALISKNVQGPLRAGLLLLVEIWTEQVTRVKYLYLPTVRSVFCQGLLVYCVPTVLCSMGHAFLSFSYLWYVAYCFTIFSFSSKWAMSLHATL